MGKKRKKERKSEFFFAFFDLDLDLQKKKNENEKKLLPLSLFSLTESTTDCAPQCDWPAIPATCGKCAPYCLQSSLSAHVSPTSMPRSPACGGSGQCDAGIGPNQSAGIVTKMRPEAALARPDLWARSVVKASRGLSLSMRRTCGLGGAATESERGLPPALATRMASTSAVLTRAFSAKRLGNAERQVGQERLPCWVHLVKQPRQKLCWQGA